MFSLMYVKMVNRVWRGWQATWALLYWHSVNSTPVVGEIIFMLKTLSEVPFEGDLAP